MQATYQWKSSQISFTLTEPKYPLSMATRTFKCTLRIEKSSESIGSKRLDTNQGILSRTRKPIESGDGTDANG